jgi:hypothetical protein
MDAIKLLEQNLMSLNLNAITIREVIVLEVSITDIFKYQDEQFTLCIPANQPIKKDILKKLIFEGHKHLFVPAQDYEKYKDELRDTLSKVTRSLSVGDPIANGAKHISLMTLNLQNLYDNPADGEALNAQYQGSLNLGKFLIEHKDIQGRMYKDLKNQRHHFVMGQPMLSTLMMLGFLQHLRVFSQRDIEQLFITSYFKDIGMSNIPKEKFDKENLSEFEAKQFKDHANQSMNLIEGRLNLSSSYINIIKNHHYLNDKIGAILSGKKIVRSSQEQIVGLETTIVAVMDILVAMTEGRPFQKKLSVFEGLDLIRKLMADQYPHEFKALVHFIRNFFTNG